MHIEHVWFQDPPETPFRTLYWQDEYGTWGLGKGSTKGTALVRGCIPSVTEKTHPEDVDRQVIKDPFVPDEGDLEFGTQQGIDDPGFVELVRQFETGAYDDVPA